MRRGDHIAPVPQGAHTEGVEVKRAIEAVSDFFCICWVTFWLLSAAGVIAVYDAVRNSPVWENDEEGED